MFWPFHTHHLKFHQLCFCCNLFFPHTWFFFPFYSLLWILLLISKKEVSFYHVSFNVKYKYYLHSIRKENSLYFVHNMHVFVLSLVMFSVWLCSPRAQEALKTGHFVSVLQVLMQLQRVCNHPELVAPRESSSSYFCSSLQYDVPSLVLGALQDDSDKVYAYALHCLNS